MGPKHNEVKKEKEARISNEKPILPSFPFQIRIYMQNKKPSHLKRFILRMIQHPHFFPCNDGKYHEMLDGDL